MVSSSNHARGGSSTFFWSQKKVEKENESLVKISCGSVAALRAKNAKTYGCVFYARLRGEPRRKSSRRLGVTGYPLAADPSDCEFDWFVQIGNLRYNRKKHAHQKYLTFRGSQSPLIGGFSAVCGDCSDERVCGRDDVAGAASR